MNDEAAVVLVPRGFEARSFVGHPLGSLCIRRPDNDEMLRADQVLQKRLIPFPPGFEPFGIQEHVLVAAGFKGFRQFSAQGLSRWLYEMNAL